MVSNVLISTLQSSNNKLSLSCSKKFWRKVHFVPTLEDLSSHVAVDKDYIPESVYAKDLLLMASMHPDSRQKHGSQKEEQSGPTEKEEKKEKQEEEA